MITLTNKLMRIDIRVLNNPVQFGFGAALARPLPYAKISVVAALVISLPTSGPEVLVQSHLVDDALNIKPTDTLIKRIRAHEDPCF